MLLLAAGGPGGLQAFSASSTSGLLDPSARSVMPIALGITPGNPPKLPDNIPEGAHWDFQGAYVATVKDDVLNGNTETITGIASLWAKVVAPGPDGNQVEATKDLSGKDLDNYYPLTIPYQLVIQHPGSSEGN